MKIQHVMLCTFPPPQPPRHPQLQQKCFPKDDLGASLEMLTLHASGVQTRELSEGGSRETIKAEPVACAVLRGGSGDRGDLV